MEREPTTGDSTCAPAAPAATPASAAPPGGAAGVEPPPGGVHVVTRYRKRAIGPAELQLIRQKIAEQGGRPRTRKAIATTICIAWDWRQPRGTFATRACGDLLLRLQDWGHIKLPPTRSGREAPRPRPPVLPDDLIPLTGLEVRDGETDLNSLVVRPITPEEREGWCLYIERYHYLGYRPIVGEHLLYAAFLDGELVALLAWASPALNAPLREAYVGWDEATKREHLHLVADNVRFLILPWVRVRHLASKILAYNLRRLSKDWEQTWGHPVHLAESFVDPARFRGTCYRASNWVYLGQTAGRSKRGNAYLPGSSKALFVYPLRRDARRLLGGSSQTSGSSAAAPVAHEPGDAPSPIPSEVGQSAIGGAVVAAPVAAPVERSAQPSAASAPNRAGTGAATTGPRAGLAIAASALTALGAAGTAGEPVQDTATDVAVRTGETQAKRDPAPDGPGTTDSGQASDRALHSPVDAPKPRAGGLGGKARGVRMRLELTDTERTDLEILARGLLFPHRMVVRAKAILSLANGETIAATAIKVGFGRRHVRRWAERFVRKRIRGLEDAPRAGRPARFSPSSRDGACQDSLRASR